jgi:hypothetical protein
MSRDSTVIPFRQPDAIDDPLTELARERGNPCREVDNRRFREE